VIRWDTGATGRRHAPRGLAIAAIGYGDGYPRSASSGTPVLVNGEHAALAGRVSMDMIAVDVTDVQRPPEVGDPVVLWGEGLPVEEGRDLGRDDSLHPALWYQSTSGYDLARVKLTAHRCPVHYWSWEIHYGKLVWPACHSGCVCAMAVAVISMLLPFASIAACKRSAFNLPVTIQGTRPVIAAKFNGEGVRLLVDSGASFSLISSAAVEHFKLRTGMAPFVW